MNPTFRQLRWSLFSKVVDLSFVAQNKLIDQIFLENGMSELGQKIIAEVRKAAEDRPEYVYPRENNTCEYIRDGGPSCIVGHALWNVGLINENWEGDDWGDSSIKAVVSNEGWPLTIGEVNWLSRVQESQDDGFPWGRSVARADHPAFRALNEIYDDEDV